MGAHTPGRAQSTGMQSSSLSPLVLLRSLRAVRRYADRPVPEDVLFSILEAARWTGSAKNTQPWELVVVRERATLAELATCGPYASHLAGAAAAIVLVMHEASQRFDEGRLAQTLMLAAWAHGVGSCIGSLYPDDNTRRARSALGVPDERWLRTSIALGYPADERALRISKELANTGVPVGLPIGRRGLDELVGWERYQRPRQP
jgi:nitroreductase